MLIQANKKQIRADELAVMGRFGGHGFGAKGFSATIADIKHNVELREKLRNVRADVFLYDKGAPNTQAHRQRSLREFTDFSQAYLVAEGHLAAEVPKEALERYCFSKEHTIDLVCRYIAALACSEHVKGNVGEKIQPATLKRKVADLWWFAVWHLQTDAIDVWPTWDQTISAVVHQHAVRNNLTTEHRPKHYFGMPELRLLFNWILRQTTSLPWWKQNYLAWAICSITGVRPGSLAVSQRQKADRCLHWQDIEFLPNYNGSGRLAVRIHVKVLKGKNETSYKFKPLVFLITSPNEGHNLIADIPTLLLCTAIERKLFGDRSTDQLLRDDSFRLEQDDAIRKLPVFLRSAGPNNPDLHPSDPMSAGGLNAPLQRACQEVGLRCYVTMYVWRRECLTAIARNSTNDIARQYAGHDFEHDGDNFEEYYDYGPGDDDLTPIRLGESQRNQMRQLLDSAALHRVSLYPKDEERAYIEQQMSSNPEVVAFDDALPKVLDGLVSRLHLSEDPTISTLTRFFDATEPGRSIKADKARLSFKDFADPRIFVDKLEMIRSAQYGGSLFRVFLLQRKLCKKYFRENLAKEFRKQWLNYNARASTVSQKIVLERQQAALSLPEALQPRDSNDPVAGPVTNKRKAGSVLPKLEQEGDNLQGPEDDDEIDAFEALDDNTCVEVTFDSGLKGFAASDAINIEPARGNLREEWLQLKSMVTSQQDCFLCEAHWSCMPSFEDPKKKFGLGLKSSALCKHLEYEFHTSDLFTSYALSSFRENNQNFCCRLCTRSYTMVEQLKKHLKETHQSMTKRLMAA